MLAAIWVTTQCNMQCKYCYEGPEKPQKAMTRETADKAIAYIKRHFDALEDSFLIVNFHGGEPLIEFEIIKYIIAKLKDVFGSNIVKFGITTNGLLLDEETEKYLAENINYSLSISIDGARSTHDAHRLLKNGQGTYDLIINKCKSLLEKKPDLRARMTFNSSTADKLYDNVKHLVDLGFTTIAPVPDYFDKNWDEKHIPILHEQFKKIAALSTELKARDKNIRIGVVDDLDYINKGRCSGGKTTIHIDPEGKIYPCTYTVGNDYFQIGDVESGINSSKVVEIANLSYEENKECLGCSNYKACIGTRCKLVNKVITGEYNSPPPILCLVENIKYKLYKSQVKV